MLADALIKTRGALVDAPAGATLSPAMPGIDDAMSMTNWAPFVRQHVLLFDLISALHFETGDEVAWLHHCAPTTKAPPGPYLIAMMRRPAPPVFEAQVKLVDAWADLREERTSEILSQLTPQFAYWNAVASLNLERRPKTLELMCLALAFASFVEMRFKHALACPRPVEYSPHIQPIIATPLHGSLPSGHATEAFMIVHLIEKLLPHGAKLHEPLQRLAARTSINRTVAGVHFPIDSIAGQMLGQTLGEYLVWKCLSYPRPDAPALPATPWSSRVFEAPDGAMDFLWDHKVVGGEVVSDLPPVPKDAAPSALGWLWDQARAEWPHA
jgi:membrane-associated phospholipid phosphatase